MRIIESRSIDSQAGLLGSRLITGTNTTEGAFQSFIVAENTIVTKVYNSIGIDVTGRLGLTSITLKAGAFISMPKGDYFSSIKLASGSIVAYFTSHGGMSISADAYLNEFLARIGSSYLEASECVKSHLQQLINIGLLQKASLIMSPSMYEEDLVKSVVPQDGNGDLSFTRASDGTRINSAGLVEVTPWNLAGYSEQFDNAYWNKQSATVTANSTTAPNGTLTADTFNVTATAYSSIYNAGILSLSLGIYTQGIYAKKGTKNYLYILDLTATSAKAWFNLDTGVVGTVASGYTATMESVGNGWYRCSLSQNTSITPSYFHFGASDSNNSFTPSSSGNIYIWGAQLNIGSTAKPYFPTTDRLDVPRLTYQNGGGGCPSLLLEKQSTNLLTYSEQFDQWSTSGTTTTNAGISPDGTQNADRLNFTSGNVYWLDTSVNVTNGIVYTYSLYVKPTSVGNQFRFYFDGAFNDSTVITTDSSDWKQYTWTFTASATGSLNPHILLGYGYSSQSILVWGAQLEASSYVTSYIPTTTTSATRVADACFKTGISSLIGQTEGVLFCDFEFVGYGSVAQWIAFLMGAPGDYIGFYTNIANKIVMEVSSSGVAVFLDVSITLNVGTRYKMAVAYKANDFAFYVNGSQISIDSSGSVPSCSEFNFNYNTTAANIATNKYNQAALFPTRLTNAELASLTTL